MEMNRRTLLGTTLALSASSMARAANAAEQLSTTVAAAIDVLPGRTKNLRYAVNIEMWGFGTDDPAERIRRAVDLGFTAVEMWRLAA